MQSARVQDIRTGTTHSLCPIYSQECEWVCGCDAKLLWERFYVHEFDITPRFPRGRAQCQNERLRQGHDLRGPGIGVSVGLALATCG